MIKTTEKDRKQIRHAIVANLKFNEVNVIDLTPKLPKGWKDFKIVETVSGSFTGQITTNVPDRHTFSRVKLRNITKKYLESLLGYEIEKYYGKKKK